MCGSVVGWWFEPAEAFYNTKSTAHSAQLVFAPADMLGLSTRHIMSLGQTSDKCASTADGNLLLEFGDIIFLPVTTELRTQTISLLPVIRCAQLLTKFLIIFLVLGRRPT